MTKITYRKPALGGLGQAGSGSWAGEEQGRGQRQGQGQGQGQGQDRADSPCGTLHSTDLRNGSPPQNNCSLNT